MFEMFEMFTIILSPKTFNIESKAIFVFSFCIGLVTQLNGSVLGVLKDNYVIKRTRKLAFGNSGFLIQNLLKPTTLLYGYKRNLPFVDWYFVNFRHKLLRRMIDIEGQLNPMASQQFFHVWIDLKPRRKYLESRL